MTRLHSSSSARAHTSSAPMRTGADLGPTSLYPGLTTPAAPGEVVILYANGFGPISPAVVAGSEAQSGKPSDPRP